MLHTFENGFCTICGTNLDYEIERMHERSIIGPLLPADENQGTFQLTVAVMV